MGIAWKTLPRVEFYKHLLLGVIRVGDFLFLHLHTKDEPVESSGGCIFKQNETLDR